MIVRLCLSAAIILAGLACARAQGAYWGSPSVDGGKCCRSLNEVRDHIDALDRQILGLMAERQKYVGEAGRFKKDPAAVSAPARVEAIIAKARGIAREEGLAESVAERTYRAMIAAFEDYERAEWTRRNANGAPAQ
jgi:isochorismate pyruvate lyase